MAVNYTPRSTLRFHSWRAITSQDPDSPFIFLAKKRKERSKIYLILSTFSIQIITAQYFSQRQRKKINFLWLFNPYENPIWLLPFFRTSTICALCPLQVISDLWVPFSGGMITVFHGGGERSDGLMSLGGQAGRGGQTGALLLLWRYDSLHASFASFISLAKALSSSFFFHIYAPTHQPPQRSSFKVYMP